MPEIIQKWLGNRLGILLDLTPHKFGRITKDGVLLAQLLYSYGVIPVHVFNQVKESKNYFDCLNNLKLLKPWLEHIGVTQDITALQEVASGDGSAAISLFYAVFLNLERNDRLHYISAQKERRFSEDSCKRKFKIEWVPEASLKKESQVSFPDAERNLLEKKDIIKWHRAKCKEVVNNIKKIKRRFMKVIKEEEHKLGPVTSKHATSQPIDKCFLEAEDTKETILSFEKKHIHKYPNLNYSELIKLRAACDEQSQMTYPNPEEAKNILNKIKHRKRNEIYARNFQESIQEKILDEHWKDIINKQNEKFENTLCQTFLKRSQYEKQMASKLNQLRKHKKVSAENQKMIENLKTEQRSRDFDSMLTSKMEMRKEFIQEEQCEKERILKLHKKVYFEKVRARREYLKMESENIVQCIIDIAIRVTETRELTNCQVPKALMKDWKELYFKNLPIFDSLSHLEELYEDDFKTNGSLLNAENEEEGEVELDLLHNQIMSWEKHKHNALNEADFVDYLNLRGPWMMEMLFPDNSDAEVKQIVLGYVVHKLLEIKYPVPNRPKHFPIRPMKPAVILQNLEEEGCKMLTDLMNPSNILVVVVDDAINFVLSVYKEELSVVRDIDITFKKLTEKAFHDKYSSEKEKDVKKKVQLLKKEEPAVLKVDKEPPNFISQETQTPRMIPEDDPLLSPNAMIGKVAFEALGAGDPVPDVAIASAIVAYVKSKQNDYDGWILLNYPQLYLQASELECSLTGYRLLPIGDHIETLEEIEGFSYREPCVDPFINDTFAQNRISRLVSKPNVIERLPENPKTYFNLFIKLKKVNHTPKYSLGGNPIEVSTLEDFYKGQDIFYLHEYSSMNFQTIKNIGKMILCWDSLHENSPNVVPKTSLEIFGDHITELYEKWDSAKKKKGKSSDKETSKDVKKQKAKESPPLGRSEPEIHVVEVNYAEDHKVRVKKILDSQPHPKPGDTDWEWAKGEQPEGLLLALASLWENMEAVFTEDLKDTFFGLRVHRANVLSYIGFIRKSIKTVMKQPDEKQKVLGDFQQMFNDIDEDLRPDLDIKCELHVRVSELEEALLGIADERKTNSLKDVKKVAQDGWVADEMANLVNHFLTIAQLEADRCLETCQILIDYYAPLLHKIPEEKNINKIAVAKLQIKDRKYSVISSPSSKTFSLSPNASEIRALILGLDQNSKASIERPSKSRSYLEKRKRTSEMTFLTGASEVINEILTSLTLPSDGVTPFHNFGKESIQAASNEVKSIMESFISDVKKGEKAVTKHKKGGGDATAHVIAHAGAELESALNNELSRFLFRMKLILARCIFDLNEFLATILNVLCTLTEDINEMYLREIQSISECCKIFRCSIEEEIPIQPQLELKEDFFLVNPCVLLFPTREESIAIAVDKEQQLHFTVEQLQLIFEKLCYVAPNGEIIKRSLLYIMEDLRALHPEIRNCRCFPEAWKLLEPDDVVSILNEIYQDLEIVHWRDFIIYALEIPVPTEDDILSMRKLFRELDPNVTELISREDYEKVHFWFETTEEAFTLTDRDEMIKDLLFKMYQVDESYTNYSALLLAFCKDENPIFGFTKALALVTGKQIITNEFADNEFSYGLEGEEGGGIVEDFYEKCVENGSKTLYDCPSPTQAFPSKCIAKDKFIRCNCKDMKDSSTGEEESITSIDIKYSEEGENGSLHYYDSHISEQHSKTDVIPYNILYSLLKASFPSLPQLSALMDCNQTFQDILNSVYDNLETQDGQIKIYQLLRHKFLSRLIQSTNKFRFVDIKQILINALKAKNLLCQSFCFLDRLNCNMCLD